MKLSVRPTRLLIIFVRMVTRDTREPSTRGWRMSSFQFVGRSSSVFFIYAPRKEDIPFADSRLDALVLYLFEGLSLRHEVVGVLVEMEANDVSEGLVAQRSELRAVLLGESLRHIPVQHGHLQLGRKQAHANQIRLFDLWHNVGACFDKAGQVDRRSVAFLYPLIVASMASGEVRRAVFSIISRMTICVVLRIFLAI